jgi:hypothetical protein
MVALKPGAALEAVRREPFESIRRRRDERI